MSPSVLQRIASGDSAAVRECIEQYGALVWSLARRLSRSPSDAEDATQEIFLDIWRSAARFDASQGSDKMFIAMIARRRLIDRLRKTSAEPPMDPVEALETVAWADPGTASETSLEAEQAARALAELRPEQRQVLELGLMHGLSSVRDRDSAGHAAGHRQIVHAPGSDQGARIHEHRCRTRLERGLMAGPGPQDQPDEAMVDLLIKQVTEGLSPAEQRALDVLDSAVASAHLRDLERAAAAVALAGSADAAAAADRLWRQLIERQAAAAFRRRARRRAIPRPARRRPVPRARGDPSSSCGRTARAAAASARRASGAYGWLAAAACLVLAVIRLESSPPPPGAGRAPVHPRPRWSRRLAKPPTAAGAACSCCWRSPIRSRSLSARPRIPPPRVSAAMWCGIR